MKHNSIIVRAEWDAEAGVWVATSDDIGGLALESETIESLREKVVGAITDLINLNQIESDLADIPVHFMAESLIRLNNPSH